uniref:Fibronectin type-III domain-containing protein n=1 Tax=Dictyoglomus thermophilum TaxID=14 RepID=A0A7C3MHR5_DICTH
MKTSILKLFGIIFILLFIAGGCVTKPAVSNQPPLAPSNPNPQDNATNVPITVTLSWTCSDPDGDSLKYDIYFGDTETPQLREENYTSTTYTVENLNYNTTYYWKIVAKDGKGGVKSGPIWSFTTVSEGTIIPVFKDSFENNKTNNEDQYTSPYYQETISSVRGITFTKGVVGDGVHLDGLDSYICYSTSYINPTEGTIMFYFKPDSNMYEFYQNLESHKGGFLIDTVGWLDAFTGAFFIAAWCDGENHNNFWSGTWNGSFWSYAYTDPIYTLSPDKFYKIAFTWSQTQGKIKLYLDGELMDEESYNTPLNNEQLFFIGHNPFGLILYNMAYWPYGARSLMGTYDELEIYDVALEF